MSSIKEIKNSFFKILKENKKLQLIIVVVLAIILIVSIFSNENKSNTINDTNEITQYVNLLEDKLCKLLSKVEGCGKVSVAITIDSSMETVLAMKKITTESSGKIEIEETPIIVNGKTVVLKENFPKITGVLIVCEGANKISVMKKIQQATTSLLDVDINKIEILAMK